MASWVVRFLKKSPAKRREIVLTENGMEIKKRDRRSKIPKMSMDEVVEYLKKYNIKSRDKLRLRALEDRDGCPSESLIIKLFGSFKKARVLAFGGQVNWLITDQQLANLLIENKIFKSTQYDRYHLMNPDVFPPRHELNKRFGSWGNIARLVRGSVKECVLERYIALSDRLGHFPTKKECLEEGVEVEILLDVMDKNELIELVTIIRNRFDESAKRN